MYSEKKFSWIRQKMENFPIDPIVKMAHFSNVIFISKYCSLWQRHVYRHGVAKVGDFYNGCLWGKFYVFCRILLKFHLRLHKKRWYTSWKLQLEIRINKKVIAKKLLTNLYEMNSNFAILDTSDIGYAWRHPWIVSQMQKNT